MAHKWQIKVASLKCIDHCVTLASLELLSFGAKRLPRTDTVIEATTTILGKSLSLSSKLNKCVVQ